MHSILRECQCDGQVFASETDDDLRECGGVNLNMWSCAMWLRWDFSSHCFLAS